MKITVIGAGYVGLTTAACFAQVGHEVFCSESDSDKLQKLQSGVMPIYEPQLEPIVTSAMASGKLRFGTTNEGIDYAEVIFICVGTPPHANGDADLSAIERLARDIAKRAKGYRLVVEKSTVPVQTGLQLKKHIASHSVNGLQCEVASNPEFLREGSSIYDLLHPDRIVVGTDSARATEILREIYAPIIEGRFECPLHSDCDNRGKVRFLVTDTNSAELIKHASNSFLATKISFINMVADLCEVVGADVSKVAEGMGLDPRIGSAFLNPGIGFGGFCFPKDVQAFRRIAEKNGCDFSLLQAVEDINKRRIAHFIGKLREELWIINGKRIALWGLAFKPNTDDVRFAPAIALIEQLKKEGAVINAYDPQATHKAREICPDVNYCASLYEAAEKADAILVATEWDEFREVDWERVAAVTERRLVLDGRNMFDRSTLSSYGFRYVSIGRQSVEAPEAVFSK